MFTRSRSSLLPGWVACVPQGAQAALACVRVLADAGQAPQLQWACLEDWQQPAATLSRLTRRHQIGRHPRVLLLQPAQYRLLTLDAPTDLPRQEWAAAVRWQLKDLVDFAVDSAAVDVLALPEGASYRRHAQLLAVAAPAEALRPMMDAAHDADLPWQAIDIVETALRNLCALAERPGRAQALLHCQDAHSTLVVSLRGELLATRSFELSQRLLRDDNPAVRQQALDHAGLELQRTLDGVERNYGQVALASLLVGPMAERERLCEHLRPLLYTPVLPYPTDELIDLSAQPGLSDDAPLLNQLLVAIGAALRDGELGAPLPPEGFARASAFGVSALPADAASDEAWARDSLSGMGALSGDATLSEPPELPDLPDLPEMAEMADLPELTLTPAEPPRLDQPASATATAGVGAAAQQG